MRSKDACVGPLLGPVMLFLALGSAAAQEPAVVRRIVPADAARLAPVELPPGVVPAGATAAEPTDPQAAQRLQMFLQLQFDRRPSAILEAWASPEPEKPAAEAAEGEAPAGAPGEASGEAPPDAPAGSDAGAEDPAAANATPPPEGWFGATEEQAAAAALAAQQAAAAEAQAQAAAQAAAEAAKQQRLVAEIGFELKRFQRDVTLGRWDRVGRFFERFEGAQLEQVWKHFLTVLPNPPREPNRNVPAQYLEQPTFDFSDVLGVAAAAPGEGLQKEHVKLLAPLAQRALTAGHSFGELVALLEREAEKPAEEQALTRRQSALLLAALGRLIEMGTFLPSPEEAEAADDREALNLLSRHYVALHTKEKRTEWLEKAWDATLAALAVGEIDKEQKAQALGRAVELAPKVREALGDDWLIESFTARPERGKEILATMGAVAARGFEQRSTDPEARLRALQLQSTAVRALIEHSPERAGEWQEALALLAGNWLTESLHSYDNSEATSAGPYMQRDAYGNVFWMSNRGYRQNPVQPIDPFELLEIRPSDRWLALLDPGLRPKYAMVVAKLWLKLQNEVEAFPHIERLAATHPEEAQELAAEFLRVWTTNNDPNAQTHRTNAYMYMYGFERRANAIPLTRSKQERNLRELAKWVERLRALPIEDLDEDLLLNAFTASHSTAEVYRLETIENVFGSIDALEPRTLASLAQRMRANLAGVWRLPEVQKSAGTKRRQKDIEAEVLHGYEVAGRVIERGVSRYPDEWSLRLAQAALVHDVNDFGAELASDSGYSERRRAALTEFEAAARLYAEAAPDMREDEWTTDPFDTWFYAALGACDLGRIDERTRAVPGEPAKIRAVLESLPGDVRTVHFDRFANALFTRMSAVNPAVKYRYLKAGFEIVGDHPQAREARKVFDYYNDLVTEIQLRATIDGPDTVGHGRPFGVRVELRHTREIERESGGFGKYLQNQNDARFAYNYGRPTENYRDKFQEATVAALGEHFEVLSITFNHPDVNSKADTEYGWRRTPYAYLLLKARGPEVDTLPPLQIDLDFLDTSGYAVLPVASPPVPLDASRASPEPRPHENLEITQILDEREAKEGRLRLEIRATCNGLVPDLEQLLDLDPGEFVVDQVDDQGVAVSKFGDDRESIVSERLWYVTLRGRDDLTELPKSFAFGTPRAASARMVYQRYADADLLAAEAVVDLEHSYGETRAVWPWWLGGIVLLVVIALGFRAALKRPRSAPGRAGVALPESITPFTVLGLLRDVERRNRLDERVRGELRAAIERIEVHYFARTGDGEAPDLHRIAEEWTRRIG